jgi:hypothetical protein
MGVSRQRRALSLRHRMFIESLMTPLAAGPLIATEDPRAILWANMVFNTGRLVVYILFSLPGRTLLPRLGMISLQTIQAYSIASS